MDYSIYSPFDLEKHKATYTNYLEVVIDKTGTIMYAVPSHSEKAIAIACAELKVSRDQLMDMVPQAYYCAVHEWLCKVAQLVLVWNDGCVCDEPNAKQIAALRRMKLAGVYHGVVPHQRKESTND